MTNLPQETDPLRRESMERQARKWIGTLRPNRQHPYLGIAIFIIALCMLYALATDPFSAEYVWDLWGYLSIPFLAGFILISFLFGRGFLSDIEFGPVGIGVKPWGFGNRRTFDWNDVDSCLSQPLGNALRMSDGSNIKFSSSGSFSDNLSLAVAIFESRYNLDDESDE